MNTTTAAPTRRYFGTDGIRGKVGGPLMNPAFALRLGYAAGRTLVQGAAGSERPTVLIGKDTRSSGYMLESALEAGLSAAGVDVLLAGPLPTPGIAHLTRTMRLAAGIVISASHNPYDDNGIKFFAANGMKLDDTIEARIEAALDMPLDCLPADKLGRARRLGDANGRYIEFCKHSFPTELDLTGLRIVIDAAHGAAYQVAPAVLRELGAQVIPIGCAPDGFNINAGVGATAPEALAAAVLQHRADLGIALDGDADRLVMVGADGRVYLGDALLYGLVRHAQRKAPVAGVVGTLMTNYAFERRMQEQGIGFVRAAVGDRYVLEAMLARGWKLGGEGSGHLLCLDAHTTGDGMIAALQILAALREEQMTLAELLDDLVLYPQTLLNLPWHDGKAWQHHAGLQATQAEVEQTLAGRGRVLIRASGTEPILRIMVEADDEALALSCAERLAASLTA